MTTRRGWALVTYAVSCLFFLAAWQFAAMRLSMPLFLPSPQKTALALRELILTGDLAVDAKVSLLRILTGFAAGSLVGVPIGLAMGQFPAARRFFDPQIQFLRFVPPIAILPLAMLWLGTGEQSKVFLVFYATSFLIILGTAAGVAAIPRTTLRAAGSLGANPGQLFFHVILPASVPSIANSMATALGLAFMTIVSAEMVASRIGLGYLVYSARLRYQTDWIFVGIAALGVLGFLSDRLFRVVGNRITGRYGTKL